MKVKKKLKFNLTPKPYCAYQSDFFHDLGNRSEAIVRTTKIVMENLIASQNI